MTDKIIVEFSRKKLKKICANNSTIDKFGKPLCEDCEMTDKDLIECNLIFNLDFKIKDNKNERKDSDIRQNA